MKKLWDVIDILILISPIGFASFYAWHIHDYGWATFFTGFGPLLGISEIIEKLKTGHTMTQIERGYWKIDRKKALVIWGSILAFFLYLEFFHLMKWNP